MQEGLEAECMNKHIADKKTGQSSKAEAELCTISAEISESRLRSLHTSCWFPGTCPKTRFLVYGLSPAFGSPSADCTLCFEVSIWDIHDQLSQLNGFEENP